MKNLNFSTSFLKEVEEIRGKITAGKIFCRDGKIFKKFAVGELEGTRYELRCYPLEKFERVASYATEELGVKTTSEWFVNHTEVVAEIDPEYVLWVAVDLEDIYGEYKKLAINEIYLSAGDISRRKELLDILLHKISNVI